VELLVALTLVCAAALVGLRALGRRDAATAGMRVVGRLALEPRRAIYLIEVGGRFFAVGVGDGPMTMLTEVEAPALPAKVDAPALPTAVDALALPTASRAADAPVLARAWRRLVGGRA
jgi:flagellar biogenesis protein FliO